jgi:hypothetical protein
MTKKFISGGCSFTYGHELSDDDSGRAPSQKSWAALLHSGQKDSQNEYLSVSRGGIGNCAIARKVFKAISENEVDCVVVMWTFLSRYDWAMKRHSSLEDTRWASLSPWDTDKEQGRVFDRLSTDNDQLEVWNERREIAKHNGTSQFAGAIYRYAANMYHEAYLSWKSIVWLQNILEKKKIPFLFTLADNSLFYDYEAHLKDMDKLLLSLHSEIDFTKWFSFGERMMGFNQWASLNGYEYATTHPLDQAHEDAVKLMLPTFNKLIGEKR